jgi:glycosyltransferase involved in cell wall biosynthesis
MRFLVDARPLLDPTSGGVSRVARGIIDAFIAANTSDDIILATTGSAIPSSNLLPHGQHVRHVHLRIPNKLWSLACTLGLVSLEKEIAKRVGPIDATFLPNLGFIGGGRITMRPYVLLLHDLSFLIEPRWFSMKQRLWHRAVGATSLIKHATRLLAVSETTKRDAMRLLNIPAESIDVIPVGSTLTVGETEVRPAPTGRYLLALGWNDARKNAKTAVTAIEILKQDPAFSDLDLVIVGRDVVRPTDSALATLYSHASAFLYPSWYEGYGLPLHEAASYGTPCIASTAGALPETAPPGTIFADPAKPHHWAEAIRGALQRPSRTHLPSSSSPSWTDAARILRESFRRILS